ncbi:MAG: GNAT family N-acetyltransferase [Gammaproteobacteria bacterium]|nr:GNAT family N-acetyltransferase [Gammaproteobacteria bacterium]MDH3766945.1 GNAT family N-acetyltransferase [Gammaproteobacteria bacterium]
MTLKYESTESPRDDDVAIVRKHLRAYNRSRAEEGPDQKLAIFARDDGNNIVGGVTGRVSWGWLYVDLLWVHENHRGHDVGSRLLAQIEDMARPYNVVGFHLGTTDFQALDFYLKNGYDVWGQLPDYPPGYTNYSLRKLNND